MKQSAPFFRTRCKLTKTNTKLKAMGRKKTQRKSLNQRKWRFRNHSVSFLTFVQFWFIRIRSINLSLV